MGNEINGALYESRTRLFRLKSLIEVWSFKAHSKKSRFVPGMAHQRLCRTFGNSNEHGDSAGLPKTAFVPFNLAPAALPHTPEQPNLNERIGGCTSSPVMQRPPKKCSMS
jgi:hypothetical protein